MKRVFILLALLMAALPRSAGAQSGARLTLRPLQTESFPIISGYLTARDSVGTPISDLQLEELTAVEDGVTSPIDQLRLTEAGLRVILVINPTEAFAIRNSDGMTRFEIARQAIIDWASLLSATSDTSLSLITPEGAQIADDQAAEWLSTLETYELSLAVPEVNTQTITEALDLSSRETSDPGTGAAIWWITATPRQEALTVIDQWSEQLLQAGTSLFIWQIDSPTMFNSQPAQLLQELAQDSGGALFSFSGTETLPQPESYFSSLRTVYFFQYTSAIRGPGSHDISLRMQREGNNINSLPARFDLNIEPPSPILVSPPGQIERGPSESDPGQLAPFNQPIEIVVEFPDGFERNLTRTTLYVNEDPVAENRANPFTRFVWDLTVYDQPQQVFLRVEVEDELGLVGSTVEFPVDIIVQNSPGWFQVALARSAPVFALSIIIISAGAFFLIMVLSGRIDPTRFSRRPRIRRARLETPIADPLLDSPLQTDQISLGDFVSEPGVDLEEAILGEGIRASAYLQSLNIQDQNQRTPVHPLPEGEFLIGSERNVDLVLEDTSVDVEHARIVYSEGSFRIVDLGSSAGTWVNYAPVSRDGAGLRNGDLIHIGRVAFRFVQEEATTPTE
ncbi:MAG: FHA domain-containing protein [Anaerolineales bacterium]